MLEPTAGFYLNLGQLCALGWPHLSGHGPTSARGMTRPWDALPASWGLAMLCASQFRLAAHKFLSQRAGLWPPLPQGAPSSVRPSAAVPPTLPSQVLLSA